MFDGAALPYAVCRLRAITTNTFKLFFKWLNVHQFTVSIAIINLCLEFCAIVYVWPVSIAIVREIKAMPSQFINVFIR